MLQAQHLMERALDFMRTSKQSAVPRVPTSNPWSTTLGRTGTALRKARSTYNESLTSDTPEKSKVLLVKMTLAKRNHASSIRNAPSLRHKMLMAMATEVSLQRNFAPSSAIRQIQNVEESKRMHKKHKFILKAPHPGRIKTVVIPIPSLREETIWEKLDEKLAMRTLLAYNERHLMSSSISPFAHGPLHDAIKANGGALIPSAKELITKHELDTAYGNLSDPVSSILAELAQKTDKDNFPLKFDWTFNREAYRNAFSNSRTKTAPGFSSMTMSLWKAIVDDDVRASIYLQLIELPFKYGFSYP